MPEIKLTHVTKRWGKFYAVDDLSLDMEDNSFITLLGPSGCGKTTTLRMIAGLETPTSGQIKIGDRVVFDSEAGINVPANKRKVGFLFQNYALWPNMTVYQNISFGLGNIKEELPVIEEEAKALKSMIKALENPGELVKLIEECRDKKGKLDLDMVYLKLIDNYTISIYTAKELYNYKLHEAADKESAAKQKKQELTAKLDSILAGHKEKGEELNEKFEVVSGGKVVTRVRKYSKEEIDLAVRRVSRIVKIGMFMNRYPAELSGGQQQRVAIARTLAPEPQVLFMDEPLSNLDAKLRAQMRVELVKLHKQLDTTIIYVTHDQTEAMTLGTKIVVMKDGLIQQVGAPQSIYDNPVNLFVAGFLGSPSMNFFQCTVKAEENNRTALLLDDAKTVKKVYLDGTRGKQIADRYNGRHVILGIRPEDIYELEEAKKLGIENDSVDVDEPVVNREMLGAEVILYFDEQGKTLAVRLNPENQTKVGEKVSLYFDMEKAHVFDPETEENLF